MFRHTGVVQGVMGCGERIADNDLRSGTDIVAVHFAHNVRVTQGAAAVPGIFELGYPAAFNLGACRTINQNQLAII